MRLASGRLRHNEAAVDSPGAENALTRRAVVWGALLGVLELALPARLRAASFAGALVSEVTVHNGAARYAGDGPLLTTVAPGGDRGRDRAIVGFRLARPATVRLDV